MTYYASIDEISGEIDITTDQPDSSWPMTAELTCGDYRIREYRSDRNHLAIEVEGPIAWKAAATAKALFDLYWTD